jgi:hypothetical protein
MANLYFIKDFHLSPNSTKNTNAVRFIRLSAKTKPIRQSLSPNHQQNNLAKKQIKTSADQDLHLLKP